MVLPKLHVGGQYPDCFKQEEADYQHQHRNGLLQEFYAMAQKHNEPIGQYAVRQDMATGKV